MIGSTDKSTERQECFEKPAGRPLPETSLKLAHFPGGSGHYDGCFIGFWVSFVEVCIAIKHRMSMCALVFSPLLANSVERVPLSLDDSRLCVSGKPALGR